MKSPPRTSVFDYASILVECPISGLDGPCVVFLGYVCPKKGYGFASIRGKLYQAHRLAWVEERGPIEGDLTVDHLCLNKTCINTRHMELVTRAENTRRSLAAITRREKTHCPQGHPYSGENLYIDKENKRHCMTCRSAGNRRSGARKKEARRALAATTIKLCRNKRHEMTSENTKTPDGFRRCVSCSRERSLRCRRKRSS